MAPPTVSESKRTRANVDISTHVTFPGLEPVHFKERHAGPFGEIARPFEPLEKRFPWVPGGTWRAIRENPLEILTTDHGAIVRISRNSGLFPSVSERHKVLPIFRKAGIEVIRMGNKSANVRNVGFMIGLFDGLIRYFGVQRQEIDRNGVCSEVPAGELEAIPITYIDRRVPQDGSTPNEEHSGLLWMVKHDYHLPEDIAAMWHYDIPIEDARWVRWIIMPIDTKPEDRSYWQMWNRETWIDTPDFTFERKIRRLGDTPDRPIPPATNGPRPVPPPLAEPDPPPAE